MPVEIKPGISQRVTIGLLEGVKLIELMDHLGNEAYTLLVLILDILYSIGNLCIPGLYRQQVRNFRPSLSHNFFLIWDFST